MEILSVAETRALERTADARGLSDAQMMQNAGQGAAQIIRKASKPDGSSVRASWY